LKVDLFKNTIEINSETKTNNLMIGFNLGYSGLTKGDYYIGYDFKYKLIGDTKFHNITGSTNTITLTDDVIDSPTIISNTLVSTDYYGASGDATPKKSVLSGQINVKDPEGISNNTPKVVAVGPYGEKIDINSTYNSDTGIITIANNQNLDYYGKYVIDVEFKLELDSTSDPSSYSSIGKIEKMVAIHEFEQPDISIAALTYTNDYSQDILGITFTVVEDDSSSNP